MDDMRKRLQKILVDYPKDTYKYSDRIGISKQTLDRFMWGNSKTFKRVEQKIESFVLQEELRDLIKRYEEIGHNIRSDMNKDLSPLTTRKILSDHEKEFTHKYRSEIEAVITKYEDELQETVYGLRDVYITKIKPDWSKRVDYKSNELTDNTSIQSTNHHDDGCDICERYVFWRIEKNHCEKRMALLAKGHEQYIYSTEDDNE